MSINHSQLRSFHAVATEGSFTKAANSLNVTQPTLSGQVKALEDQFGVRLFDRRKRRIELTDIGRNLFDITFRLFSLEREAEQVMDLLKIGPGMTVADIGAGNGYYTVRLSRRVGPEGRVFAEDIIPAYLQRLQGRVSGEGLENVIVSRGDPHDPRLPVGEADVALLVHMYHEVSQPYGLLWNLNAALKPGARVAVVDVDRPTSRHGTPPKLLECEMGQVGYRMAALHRLTQADAYLAVFESDDPRPPTAKIRACKD